MNPFLQTAQALSALGFLGYGAGCLTSQIMKDEFLRYGLPQLRVLTGTLQLLAAIGLLLGFIWPVCAMLAALGLSLMMGFAVVVRLRIRDPISGFLQAFVCLLLNLLIFASHLFSLLEKNA